MKWLLLFFAVWTLHTAHAGEIPGWGVPLAVGGCGSCGTGNSTGEIDVGTLFRADLGPGDMQSHLGALVLRSTEGSNLLGDPAGLQFEGDITSSELEVVYDSSGRFAQIVTPRVFINISVNTSYKYTFRIMKLAAKGSLSGGRYAVNSSSAYLLREFTIENPDTSSANNRVKVRDTGTSAEWLFAYSNGISGWTLTLPTSIGSVDLISTNHAPTAWTLIKRYKDGAGTTIAQRSQVFTNLSWGTVMLQEVEGVGSDVRTNRWSYYTSGLPFSPTSSTPPIYTEELADGSWRLVESYDASGRVTSELHGIDSLPTTTASLARRVTYSYAAQHADDTLDREPDSPRKIEEFWKGTLVGRTYHVYAPAYHRMVTCPNPLTSITALASESDKLESVVEYDYDTTIVLRRVSQDGTVWLPTTTIDVDGTKTTVADSGQHDGSGWTVAEGFRVEDVYSPTGILKSHKKWAIQGSSVGPLVESTVASNFEDFGRPQRFDYLDGLYKTATYACCGLASQTDKDGTVTSFDYDALGRQTIVVRYNVTSFTVLDAADRVVEEGRIGTDSSTISQKGYGYDTTGFKTKETNFLSATLYGVTSFARTKVTGNFDQVTQTNPDGGTRVDRFLADGRTERTTGTAVSLVRYVYGVTSTSYNGSTRSLRSTQQIKLLANGTDTGETVTQCQDGAGRPVKVIWPGSVAAYTYYNGYGQKAKEVDADGVTQLFRYDGQGQLVVTAVDLDQDSYVDNYDAGQSGPDRVTQTLVTYLDTGAAGNGRGMPIRRTETRVWTAVNSASTALVSTVDEALSGLQRWAVSYKDQSTPVTTVTLTTPGTTRTVRTTAPDLSYVVQTFTGGRLTSVKSYTSGSSQVTSVTVGYDTHGRQSTQTDARNGTTTQTYNWADLIASVTTPAPGNGHAAQTTINTYNASLQVETVSLPDGGMVNNQYFPTGLLKKTWGTRTYPVEYTYDDQGRMKTMVTWQNFGSSSGAATTTWNYHSTRGWLESKVYHGQSVGTEYTYSNSGRLKTRKWARNGTGGNRILTTYHYGFDDTVTNDQHGDLAAVIYSNDAETQPLRYNYDRRGRRTTTKLYTSGTSSPTILNDTASAASTTTHNFNDAGLFTGEGYSGGTLSGLTVTVGYDGYLRRNSLGANTSTTISQSYAYDTAGRLQSVTDGSYSSTYAYHANSRLISTITSKQSTTTRLTVSRNYDRLERLIDTQATPAGSGQMPVSFSYAYNDTNQRTRVTLNDGSYWLYQYDSLGQVTSGRRYWLDGTPVAGQQFEYGFDTIGNRLSAKFGGDANGQNLQSATYTPNLLNQYVSRTVPGVVQVNGLAEGAATVTVNSAAAYERGEYFWKEVSVSNGSNPVWQSLSIQAVNGASSTTSTGNLYVPKTPELYDDPATSTVNEGYDADGNQLRDGRWNYTWDAENRLIRMVAATAVGPQQRLDFEYDGNSRRVRKKGWNNTSGTGSPATDLKFLYDGWNLMAELDSSSTIIRSYLWGYDISETFRGAGGTGGLLAVNTGSGTLHFSACDGNGNVILLVDGASAIPSATYEYGPFGERIRETGVVAVQNPFGFSTKYTEKESGFLYYGYRYFSPSTGRWLSRDPIEENGGIAIYAFVNNDSIGSLDELGLLKHCDSFRRTWDFEKPKILDSLSDWTGFDFRLRSQGRVEGKYCHVCCTMRGEGADIETTGQAQLAIEGEVEASFFFPGPLRLLREFARVTGRVQGSGAMGFQLKYDYCQNRWSGHGIRKVSLSAGARISSIKPRWLKKAPTIYGNAELMGTFQSTFKCDLNNGCYWTPWKYKVDFVMRVGFQADVSLFFVVPVIGNSYEYVHTINLAGSE